MIVGKKSDVVIDSNQSERESSSARVLLTEMSVDSSNECGSDPGSPSALGRVRNRNEAFVKKAKSTLSEGKTAVQFFLGPIHGQIRH